MDNNVVPIQPPPSQAEPKHGQALLLLAAVILLALAALAVKLGWFTGRAPEVSETPQAGVVLAATQSIGGVLPPPPGFPSDIPLEETDIVESFTTELNNMGAKQLSVSYRSGQSASAKLSEYRAYMSGASYQVSEGGANGVQALFGTRSDSNLSVVVSVANGQTLVQLAYLLK